MNVGRGRQPHIRVSLVDSLLAMPREEIHNWLLVLSPPAREGREEHAHKRCKDITYEGKKGER